LIRRLLPSSARALLARLLLLLLLRPLLLGTAQRREGTGLIRNGSQEQSEVPCDPGQSNANERGSTDIDDGLGVLPPVKRGRRPIWTRG
jgi:hypothetical protein